MMKGAVRSNLLLLLSSLSIALLSTVAFVFTIVALTSADWATQAQYTLDVADPSIDTRVHTATARRGPLRECFAQANRTDPAAPWSTSCGPNGCATGDLAPWWCQQRREGWHLLVAGCVFAGLACVVALAGFITLVLLSESATSSATTPEDGRSGTGRREGEEETGRAGRGRGGRLARWRTPGHRQRLGFVLARGALCALLVLSIVLFGGGTLLLFDLLVNNQRPDGDFVTSVNPNITTDHWLMGRAIIYANLGWLPNLIGLLCMPSVEMFSVR